MLRDSVRNCLSGSFLSMPSSTGSPYVNQVSSMSAGFHHRVLLLRSLHAKGVACRMQVRGLSMSPAIMDRDIVILSPLPVGRPVEGDVVAFLRPSDQRLLIHRVLTRHSDGWLMKGDNCLTNDGVVPEECLLGLVTQIARAGRLARMLYRVRDRFCRG